MDFLSDHTTLLLDERDSVPVHLSRHALCHAQCRYRRFDEGELLTQVILGNDFSIWLHHLFIRSSVLLHPFVQDNVLALHYWLRGKANYVLKGCGAVPMHELHCRLLCLPANVQHDAYFFEGHHHVFHINFHPHHLLPIAQQYPQFEPMLSVAHNGVLEGALHAATAIRPQVRECIDEICGCDLGVGERALLLESRVRDLLRWYISDVVVQRTIDALPDRQLRTLKNIEHYIVTHLDVDLSVSALAAHAHVSRSWLQRMAQKHWGKGIHAIVTQKRMEAAAHLLLTSDKPISAIAAQVSDMSFASFSCAFHAYFEQSPTQYRKHRGQLPQ